MSSPIREIQPTEIQTPAEELSLESVIQDIITDAQTTPDRYITHVVVPEGGE